MAGVEVGHGLEAELGAVVPALSGDGSEDQSDMVARIDPVHDLAREPPRAFSEHRRAAVRPGLPLATGELVDVVAGLLAEESGQPGVGGSEGVDDYQVGVRGIGRRCGSVSRCRRTNEGDGCCTAWRNPPGNRRGRARSPP